MPKCLNHWGKNTINGATQMNEHSFKLHFCMFKRSQVKYNSLDCPNCFWNIFRQLQSLHIQSLTKIKNVFACSKHSNLENGQSLFFPNVYFSTKCVPFLLKIGKDFNTLTLMNRREKGLELIKFSFITHLSTFGSRMFLTLKLSIWKCALTKVVHVYVIKGMNA
jgi:hypothetical protein